LGDRLMPSPGWVS